MQSFAVDRSSGRDTSAGTRAGCGKSLTSCIASQQSSACPRRVSSALTRRSTIQGARCAPESISVGGANLESLIDLSCLLLLMRRIATGLGAGSGRKAVWSASIDPRSSKAAMTSVVARPSEPLPSSGSPRPALRTWIVHDLQCSKEDLSRSVAKPWASIAERHHGPSCSNRCRPAVDHLRLDRGETPNREYPARAPGKSLRERASSECVVAGRIAKALGCPFHGRISVPNGRRGMSAEMASGRRPCFRQRVRRCGLDRRTGGICSRLRQNCR